MFAGPNGAGKSTLVDRFRVAQRMTLINPDIIGLAIDPDRHTSPGIMLKAGRYAALHRRAMVRAGKGLAIETTLTGHSELRFMAEASGALQDHACVCGLADALTSLARVRERVARGGYDIPAPIIMRRYRKSLGNLPAAMALSNRVFLLDNTGSRHRLLATVDCGQSRHQSLGAPGWARDALALWAP